MANEFNEMHRLMKQRLERGRAEGTLTPAEDTAMERVAASLWECAVNTTERGREVAVEGLETEMDGLKKARTSRS